jgi:hypothetical protein
MIAGLSARRVWHTAQLVQKSKTIASAVLYQKLPIERSEEDSMLIDRPILIGNTQAGMRESFATLHTLYQYHLVSIACEIEVPHIARHRSAFSALLVDLIGARHILDCCMRGSLALQPNLLSRNCRRVKLAACKDSQAGVNMHAFMCQQFEHPKLEVMRYSCQSA